MTLCINGADIISSGCVEGKRSIYIQDGRFSEVVMDPSIVIDGTGLTLTPGLIDMQIYGFGGKEFIRSKESLLEASTKLPEYGVTSFLPTIGSTSRESYESFLSQEEVDLPGAECLGWHLEGPFLNKERCGVHDVSILQESIEEVFWERMFSCDKVKLMTLAPELPCSLKLIDMLRSHGIRMAVGHTQSSLETIEKAFAKIPYFITHLFNAMPSLHHRTSGIISAVLGGGEIPYTLIADGIHVSPDVLRICYKSNPEGLTLITDASSFLGTNEKEGYFLGAFVSQCEGKLVNDSGTLAGSTVGLDEIVRRFMGATQCSFAFAMKAASERPAKLLGIERTKGSITYGYDGDAVLWDKNNRVVATIGKGKIFFARPDFFAKKVKYT